MSDVHDLNALVDDLLPYWDEWQHGPHGQVSKDAKENFNNTLDHFCQENGISQLAKASLITALRPLLMKRIKRD